MNNKPFVFVDFDRCLGNTARLYSAFKNVIIDDFSQLVDVQKLKYEKIAIESSGGSFDIIRYLLDSIDIDQALLSEIERSFVARVQLYPEFYRYAGASDLFVHLKQNQYPCGILTYGGQAWQRMKLRTTGFADEPYLITDCKNKGLQIAAWLQEGEVPNELGGGKITSAIVIDDKAESFVGLPVTERGIQVGEYGPVSTHESVISVMNLHEAIDHINDIPWDD